MKKKRRSTTHSIGQIKTKYAEYAAAVRGYGWMAVKPVRRSK